MNDTKKYSYNQLNGIRCATHCDSFIYESSTGREGVYPLKNIASRDKRLFSPSKELTIQKLYPSHFSQRPAVTYPEGEMMM